MIHWASVGRVVGLFLSAFGATMALPLAASLLSDSRDLQAMGAAMALTVGAGGALWLCCRNSGRDLNQRDGVLLTVAVWTLAGLFGSLPFLLAPGIETFSDAVFESFSGITTTGASILTDVERLSRPILLWRALLSWLGGMGIVILVIAVLPLVGHGGMHLYRAEFSGAKSEKLRPRVAETASSLWGIYVALTAILVGLLAALGMEAFEAVVHAFATMATGGFSTRNASIGAFQSPAIEYVTVVFMLLGGASFILHFRVLFERDARGALRDYEVRQYAAAILTATLVVTGLLRTSLGYSLEPAFRAGLFQVTSIMTTTGFVTDDFELWPPLGQLILLVLMFAGGCTGSTAGGMKVSRVLLLAKVVGRECKRMVERHGVFAVRLGGRVVPESAIQSLLNLIHLALMMNFGSCIALAALGVDVFTAISAVAASMFNVGPALGGVGPTDNYSHLPAVAKWILSFDMVAGRLEFYTLIVTVTPWFWRK